MEDVNLAEKSPTNRESGEEPMSMLPSAKNDEKVDVLAQRMDKKVDTLSQRMDKLNGRMDTLSKQMDEKVDALSKRMDEKVDALTRRVDSIDNRLSELGSKLDKKFYIFASSFLVGVMAPMVTVLVYFSSFSADISGRLDVVEDSIQTLKEQLITTSPTTAPVTFTTTDGLIVKIR